MDRRALMALLAVVASGGVARADSYVRVLTQTASVRTGPGADYRVMHQAERGDVLTVKERGSRGYWFRVDLEDGSSGWIFGEQVASFEVVDDANEGGLSRMWRGVRHALFAPSPVPYSDVEISFSAGLLGGEGVFFIRPGWIIDPYFALEAFLGLSPAGQQDVYMAGLGWTLRLIPGGVLGPYLHASAGIGHFTPKADAFALKERSEMVLDVGGGFELTLRKRITVRLDFRRWQFFDENQALGAEEYTGGLAIFF